MRFPGGSWLAGPDGTGSNFDIDTAGTLEAWVYIDAYRNAPQTIISKGSSAYSYILAISSIPSNSPIFVLNSGTKILQGAPDAARFGHMLRQPTAVQPVKWSCI
jgi:hypothetical protein